MLWIPEWTHTLWVLVQSRTYFDGKPSLIFKGNSTQLISFKLFLPPQGDVTSLQVVH